MCGTKPSGRSTRSISAKLGWFLYSGMNDTSDWIATASISRALPLRKTESSAPCTSILSMSRCGISLMLSSLRVSTGIWAITGHIH